MTGRRFIFGLSLVWCLIVLFMGHQNMPTIPLDLSAGDAATRSAFEAVLWKYRIFWGILALFPLLFFFIMNVFFRRS